MLYEAARGCTRLHEAAQGCTRAVRGCKRLHNSPALQHTHRVVDVFQKLVPAPPLRIASPLPHGTSERGVVEDVVVRCMVIKEAHSTNGGEKVVPITPEAAGIVFETIKKILFFGGSDVRYALPTDGRFLLHVQHACTES